MVLVLRYFFYKVLGNIDFLKYKGFCDDNDISYVWI